MKVFSSYGRVDRDEFAPLTRYLERVCPAEGTVLWRQDDESDGLYIVESGVLRATYQLGEHTRPTEESMVPGTLAGELSALSGLTRNTTCVVERQAVLWKLSTENLRRLEEEEPKLAREFTRLVLKGQYHIFVNRSRAQRLTIVHIAAKLDYDILIAALAARQ